MKHTVFIDGQAGTTGLRLAEELSARTDIELLHIAANKRKDADERRKYFNEADLVFLCLPDAAAQEAIGLIENPHTKVIDTSTAFRTNRDWVFGMPELKGQRERITAATRVSVPGCHATGFILSLKPLIEAGILPIDYPVSCYSVTGYSGAGKSGIEEYRLAHADPQSKLHVPRHYALHLQHKHLPEMTAFTGLQFAPIFTPIKANYAQGIAMSIPLVSRLLSNKASAQDIHQTFVTYYEDEQFVRVMPYQSQSLLDEGHFVITECNNTNALEIFVFGNDEHITIMSRYDNLGKGASGAAMQNMNLMLGCDEGMGLLR